jgi:hypothetical protein
MLPNAPISRSRNGAIISGTMIIYATNQGSVQVERTCATAKTSPAMYAVDIFEIQEHQRIG